MNTADMPLIRVVDGMDGNYHRVDPWPVFCYESEVVAIVSVNIVAALPKQQFPVPSYSTGTDKATLRMIFFCFLLPTFMAEEYVFVVPSSTSAPS